MAAEVSGCARCFFVDVKRKFGKTLPSFTTLKSFQRASALVSLPSLFESNTIFTACMSLPAISVQSVNTTKEVARDLAHARDGKFEIASGAFQLGIVLISAAIITGMVSLVWLGGLFGIVGVAFGALALFAPLALFH